MLEFYPCLFRTPPHSSTHTHTHILSHLPCLTPVTQSAENAAKSEQSITSTSHLFSFFLALFLFDISPNYNWQNYHVVHERTLPDNLHCVDSAASRTNLSNQKHVSDLLFQYTVSRVLEPIYIPRALITGNLHQQLAPEHELGDLLYSAGQHGETGTNAVK